jgi:hypothetical protein
MDKTRPTCSNFLSEVLVTTNRPATAKVAPAVGHSQPVFKLGNAPHPSIGFASDSSTTSAARRQSKQRHSGRCGLRPIKMSAAVIGSHAAIAP